MLKEILWFLMLTICLLSFDQTHIIHYPLL
jgi:hypothetical protein